MITLISILSLGFFLGMRHATDADHVVAVTTIVSRKNSIRSAAWTGIFWGIGHSITVLLFGGALVWFGLVVPRQLGLSLEFSVAMMLIILGTINLRTVFRSCRNIGRSHHQRCEHSHDSPPAAPAPLDRRFGHSRIYRGVRPMIIGVVHGLAGSAAVTLLVLPMIGNAVWALAYLLVFGLGTIAGMMLVTAAIAVPIRVASNHSPKLHRYVGGFAGAGSFCFGVFLAYHIGFVEKLFAS
ncbi:MAG: sulfite exporter TauE/SafE family protein [Chthoniobacteraceae bacterium]